MKNAPISDGHFSPARRFLTALGVLIAIGLGAPLRGDAREIEGVQFADSYRTHGLTLPLNCVGLLRYRIFIKGYVAALYLGDGVRPEDVLSDVPKRLELQYFYAIAGRDFVGATDRGVGANADAATVARLRARIDRLNALYKDVKPGDRYALTYVPGAGTELSLNGQPLGTIEGPDFAAAVFAIWLGSKPLDDSLKSQLLACR
jgi:hypothetical protein